MSWELEGDRVRSLALLSDKIPLSETVKKAFYSTLAAHYKYFYASTVYCEFFLASATTTSKGVSSALKANKSQ